MSHLREDELVELLDVSPSVPKDVVSDSPPDVPDAVAGRAARAHLATCVACRDQLEDMRSVLSEVKEIQIPEPSPLFWDHFSRRVRHSIETDRDHARAGAVAWRDLAPTWLARPRASGMAVVALAAVVAASAWLVPGSRRDVAGPAVRETTQSAVVETPSEPSVSSEDASLALVAGLAAELDWDTVRDAGLTTHAGGDEDAVSVLTSDERSELGRLLQGELQPSRRGA